MVGFSYDPNSRGEIDPVFLHAGDSPGGRLDWSRLGPPSVGPRIGDTMSRHGGERFAPHPSVLSRQVGDEMVLLHADNEIYYGLNQVGARVWELFGERYSSDEVMAAVTREFDADPSQVRCDLRELIEELLRHELLVPSGA